MEAENGEIIAVVDGIDEISSLNYQLRWSFKANEILEGQEFVPCVRRDPGTGHFVVDFDRLSETKAASRAHSPTVLNSRNWNIKHRRRDDSETMGLLDRHLSQKRQSRDTNDIPTDRDPFSCCKPPRSSVSCSTKSPLGDIGVSLTETIKNISSFRRKSSLLIERIDSPNHISCSNSCPQLTS